MFPPHSSVRIMTPNTNSRLLTVFYLTQSAKEVNELGQTLGSWERGRSAASIN